MLKNLVNWLSLHKKRIAIFAVLFLLFSVLFGRLFFEGLKFTPVFFQYIFQKDIDLKKTDDRVNVLFLGIGGEKHEGPLLTDTIIYASIDPQNSKMTLVSLPRDLWIPQLEGKINTAYSEGEAQRKGGGIILAKSVVEKVLGQRVDYVLRIDFNGFVRAIDTLGGIDVEVERSFEDSQYPIAGKETDACGFEDEEFEKRATDSAILEAFPCRFEKISFNKGTQHMNGETALKFVRSRHGTNDEGTDFARARRQEKVIEAVKEKIFSLGTIINPQRSLGLYEVIKDSIDTDIKQDEYDDFIKLAQRMEKANVNSVVFYYTGPNEKEQGIVINPPQSEKYDNMWVIIPRAGNGNFQEIHGYIECEIKIGNCKVSTLE
jgi:polyisoprenyl-teichoic acid--peptidoglycan teichoic acid transferase